MAAMILYGTLECCQIAIRARLKRRKNNSAQLGKLSILKNGEIWEMVQIGGRGRQKIKKVPEGTKD